MTPIHIPDATAARFNAAVATAGVTGFATDIVATLTSDDGDPGVFAEFHALDRLVGSFWLISASLATTDTGPAIRHLTVRPWPLDEDREVTATVLRKIRPADLRDRAFVLLRFGTATMTPTGDTASEWTVTDAPTVAAADEPARDAHYRGVALDYLALLLDRSGRTRGAITELATRRNVSPGTMRAHIHRARERGFLAPSNAGRSGAAPGPKLTDQPKED